jgi:hypothetical protein
MVSGSYCSICDPFKLPGGHSHEFFQESPSPFAAFPQVRLVGRLRDVRGFLNRRPAQLSERSVGGRQPESVKSTPGDRSKAIRLGSGIVCIQLLRILVTAMPAVVLHPPQVRHSSSESAARHQPFLPQSFICGHSHNISRSSSNAAHNSFHRVEASAKLRRHQQPFSWSKQRRTYAR